MTKYFVYDGEYSYTKISADRTRMLIFDKKAPVAVENADDQMFFAGNNMFFESDVKGSPIDPTVPSRRIKEEKPLSYTKIGKADSTESQPPSPTPSDDGKGKRGRPKK